ncbi:MAG: ATP-dependent helicase, partial [Cyanobacteria bacterium NC_groundwater_1444_Ag_S-0.65um_54_12]|nr:ATP-dependent helicase [Cyanobacteria bacterium NC_groundwater_1444_Ag_S-0.65um_54_12]
RTILDILRRNMGAEDIKSTELSKYISRAKSCLLGPQEVKRVSADEQEVQMARLYAAYERRLRQQNFCDFDDQILLPVRLIREDALAAAELPALFSHILVDEFQDTNRAQYALLRYLAAPDNNLFAVGDDAQGIYGFRAADLDNLLNFERDYPNYQRILLETNYRSTPAIVALANNLIRHNLRQVNKTIRAATAGGGEVVMAQALDSFQEAKQVAEQVQSLSTQGVELAQIAILYRTHALAGLMIEALNSMKIPYFAKKSGHFYEHPAISDALGYLRLALPRSTHPTAELALEQLLRRCGVQDAALSIIRACAKITQTSLWEAMQSGDSLHLPSLAQRSAVQKAVALVKDWRMGNRSPADLLLRIIDSLQLRSALGRNRREAARQKLDILATFHEQLRRWNPASLGEVFRKVEEQLETRHKRSTSQAVQLLTIHASKGLEWDAVFVLGLEENSLPYQLAIEEGNIAEERRLCYVAITRARRFLHLSYAREKVRFGQRYVAIPSRFLGEMSLASPRQMS